jgi:hypothetical protein
VPQIFWIIYYMVQCVKWSVAHHSFLLTIKCLALFLCKHTISDCLLNPASVLHKIHFCRAIRHMCTNSIFAVSETVSSSIIRHLCGDADSLRNLWYQAHNLTDNRPRILRCINLPWKLQIFCTVLHIYMSIWKAKMRNKPNPFLDNIELCCARHAYSKA